ncbi:unnamed protein product [Closterium sp. Yama58-4]|nr:unnamed protein product [Closterium sp. Yama58-4]
MARPPSHTVSFPRSSPSNGYYYPLAAAPAFRAVVALLALVLVLLPLPQSVLAAAGAASHNHSAASPGITAAMNWLAHRPRRELSLGPSHGSHGSRGATERRMSLLERPASSRSLTLLADMRALVALNAAWQLWPSNSNRSRRCDQWEYIQCNAQGFITAVVLPEMGIDATMPLNVFSTMPYLRRLDLSYTAVNGSLPSSILSLLALAHLDLLYTPLSGVLPSTLSRLSRLTYLNIGGTGFTGRLEDLSWLSNLTNLRSLMMDYMRSISGDLSSLTFLTALRALQQFTIASDTHWTGELPVSLGTLTSLTHLDLSRIATAQFPRWVMDLTALRFLDVTHDVDYRSGVVPQDLSRLSQLQHFDATGNGLVGALPEYWTTLNHLTFLSLSGNKIEGSIPSTLSALTSLSTLDLSGNSMDSTIPRVFATTLSSLNLNGNGFSGPVPTFLGSLTGLTYMDLRENNFTGAIPESFTGLTNMPGLRLAGNQLNSGLEVVERMTWLDSLEISYNMFAGSFPSLSSSPLLSLLGVRGNSFHGSFPSALLNLTSLMYLDVGQNQLYGSIPDDISTLQSLDTLSIDYNSFHGEIPLSLFTIKDISALYLNGNRLGGSLPSRLVTGSLAQLHLQGNGLSGPLPDFAHWNTTLVVHCSSIPLQVSTRQQLYRVHTAINQHSDFTQHNFIGQQPAIRDIAYISYNLDQYCSHVIHDISNNSFYGPINSNFRSMIPDNGALLNIAGNFFYGDPMLYADGCQFCPSGVIQPLVLLPGDLTLPSGGRCMLNGGVQMTRAGANKQGQASLRQNCFTLNKQMECTANETQRSSDECLAFCSMSRELGPCDGHGACVPPQVGAAEARFTCECDDGFVPTNGTLGSTCARPAPPPAAALSTGAVVGIAVGSAAAFALLLALVVALLWPRQRRRWSDLDVCQDFGVVLLELLTRQKAAVEGTDSHISDWAARKVQVYELGELKDAGLEAPDEAVVELADIALDCLKMPASRRPPMKDVARRLHNLLSQYCGDGDHSAVVEPGLRMEGGGVQGDGGSTDTFGRSEWSEGMSGASAASKSLIHSLSEKWRMIE